MPYTLSPVGAPPGQSDGSGDEDAHGSLQDTAVYSIADGTETGCRGVLN